MSGVNPTSRFPPTAAEINNRLIPSPQVYQLNPGEIAVDVLVIEFIGMAMVALCIIVLAHPCRGRSSRRHTDS